MRWLTRHWCAVAQDDDVWHPMPPLDARALRRSLIHQLHTLHLHSPFSWWDYLGALLRIPGPTSALRRGNVNSDDDGEPPLRIVYMVFEPGESARWVMQRLPNHAQLSQSRCPYRFLETGVRYTLLLSELADDEYLEHIVYHELGHLERGHLAQSLAMGNEALLCAGADEPDRLPGALTTAQHWEQEAERFSLSLTRLARGWDPAVAPSTMAHFFDFLM